MPAPRYSLAVSRAYPSGAWIVAAIVDNRRESRTYYGYTRREAIAQFLAELAPAIA